MRALNSSALALAALVSAVPLLAQSPSDPPAVMPADSLAHARRLTDWFFSGRFDSLRVWLTPGTREERTPANLQEDLDRLVGRAGVEVEVIEERFVKRNRQTQYWRTSWYSVFPEPVLFRWAFDKEGRIAGMGLGPASSPPEIDPD
jgi:hypothetical protein